MPEEFRNKRRAVAWAGWELGFVLILVSLAAIGLLAKIL